MKSTCGCTIDFLCPLAKKLWKRKNYEGRKQYSDHRCYALGESSLFHGVYGVSYRANNIKKRNTSM